MPRDPDYDLDLIDSARVEAAKGFATDTVDQSLAYDVARYKGALDLDEGDAWVVLFNIDDTDVIVYQRAFGEGDPFTRVYIVREGD